MPELHVWPMCEEQIFPIDALLAQIHVNNIFITLFWSLKEIGSFFFLIKKSDPSQMSFKTRP